MNVSEMGVLQQVAVNALAAVYSRRGNEPQLHHHTGTGTDRGALGRLEELGLITYRTHSHRGSVAVVTSAGVEALSYLAATA
jgi:hypothetical protein